MNPALRLWKGLWTHGPTDSRRTHHSQDFTFFGGVGVALIQRHKEIAKDIRETREQVQNSHVTNLRDDIDDLYDAVQRMSHSVEGLRDDIRVERRERLALTEQVSQAVALANEKKRPTHVWQSQAGGAFLLSYDPSCFIFSISSSVVTL